MNKSDTVDLTPDGVTLDCTRCEAETGAERRMDDPDTVVRCRACGKRHSTNSLAI